MSIVRNAPELQLGKTTTIRGYGPRHPPGRQTGTTGKSVRFYRIVSSPLMKNILLYRNSNRAHNSPRPVPTEGRFAIVTIRRAQDAMDAAASGGVFPPDENAAAYGEIVWSWRRDPGATLAGVFPLTTGARKAASPRRVRISRKTIARGKPGCPGCTCS